ncbi:ABC-2 type transport system permease protein [Actinomadura madurae]|uniref:ABC-2 type transport system permease protein n=1 Tax=Actinomadura madurae TaxID=1993 RepID=A0A1I5PBF0_9ACTN|nr:ABC transporter permease [Actinomadura madurae]SFP31454.1 ABC-2 type transport system permease protein [Actinomadura madurae]
MTATTLPAPARVTAGGALAGTGTLLRFMLRRDRVRFPAWTLGVALLMGYFTTALNSVYSTTEQLESVSEFSTSPAGAIFGGPAYGYDAITLERFLSGQYGLYIMLGAALMALLTVTRHTRAEERSGRAELVRANVVGRSAQLTAALILTALMSAAVAVLVTAIMLAAGYAAAGSALFGASVGAVGLVFGGIAAIAVQIFAFPRAASGLTGAVLGAAFVLRGIGDMSAVQDTGPSWLSWLSPLGWSQQTAPYVLDRWWPLAFSLACAAATATAGYRLSARRDVDAGLVPPRPGSPRAAAWLRDAPTLAFRLQRAGIAGWSIALLIAGVAYGAFAQPMADGLDDAPEDLIAVMGGSRDLVAGYLGTMGLTMAFAVTVFAVLAVQAVRAEESAGRTEPVLATAVSRTGWLGGNLAVTAIAVPWLLFLAGLGTGAAAAIGTGDAALLWKTTLGHIAHAPAVWLLLAAAGLLYGALPRALPIVWAALGYGVVAGLFAPVLDLPDGAVRISPFAHVGEYPREHVSAAAVGVLILLTAALTALALRTFNRRDLKTGA